MTHYLFLLLFIAHGALGDVIYKSVDAQGKVTYSDQPLDGAASVEAIDLPDSSPADDAQARSNQRIQEMATVTDRLQQDRKAREQARQERQVAPYPVAPPVIVEERDYFGYPWAGRRHFPDIHRGRYPVRRGRDYRDHSAPPPDSVILTPRSRVLTPD